MKMNKLVMFLAVAMVAMVAASAYAGPVLIEYDFQTIDKDDATIVGDTLTYTGTSLDTTELIITAVSSTTYVDAEDADNGEIKLAGGAFGLAVKGGGGGTNMNNLISYKKISADENPGAYETLTISFDQDVILNLGGDTGFWKTTKADITEMISITSSGATAATDTGNDVTSFSNIMTLAAGETLTITTYNTGGADENSTVALGALSVYTASHPVKPVMPNPEDGDSVPTANPLTLSWINADPNTATGYTETLVDVYFGTDPGDLTLVDGAAGQAIETVGVDASAEGTYYWKVDSDIGEPNKVIGTIWSFTTTSDLPPTVEILTPAMMTWSDNSVTLDATVTDDASSLLTYGWTAEPDGNGNDDLVVDFVKTDESPIVTITNTTGSKVTVTMTLTAFDDANSDIVEDSVEIHVYKDTCQMAKQGEGITVPLGDVNKDCITDLLDLAEIAATWLVDYKSTVAMPR